MRLQNSRPMRSAISDLLTVQETAQFLKVSVSWIYEHVRPDAEDRLPVVKLGKYLRFDASRSARLHRFETRRLVPPATKTLTDRPCRGSVDAPESRASHFQKGGRRGSSTISDRIFVQAREAPQGVGRTLARDALVENGQRETAATSGDARHSCRAPEEGRCPGADGRLSPGDQSGHGTARGVHRRSGPSSKRNGRHWCSLTSSLDAARLQKRAQSPSAPKVAKTGGSVTSTGWLSSNGSRRNSVSDVAGRRCAIRGCCSRAFSKRRLNTDISGKPRAGREVPAEGAEREARDDRRRRVSGSC